jgi:hypothetical protein
MNFKEYLTKYTKLDVNFINDFYTTITGDYIQRYEEFLIDSEVLRKWLDVKNINVYNNMIYTHLNINYKFDYQLVDNNIMLSREGAKSLCQLFDNNNITNLNTLEEAFIDFMNDPESDLSHYL